MRLRFYAGHDTLDHARGLEAEAELREYRKAMQSQRFVESFFKTPSGGRVVLLEFLAELPEGVLRLAVGGLRVCRLQLTTPQRVLGLGQVAQHVLPLV